MPLILHPNEIGDDDRRKVGGKAFALSRLVKAGFEVPGFLSITADAYRRFVEATGLAEVAGEGLGPQGLRLGGVIGVYPCHLQPGQLAPCLLGALQRLQGGYPRNG
jgi:hypothetical protein